ncbi:MAG: ATP synthase F1 subunit delta [Acidobacteriota bacterium]
MLSIVAARYARALVDVVMAPGSGIDPAPVLAGLRTMDAIIQDSHELRTALASPAVTPSRKHAFMKRLMEPLNLPEKVRNFLYVVTDHHRGGEFSSIVDGFEHLLDQRLGFVTAEIRSAKVLTDSQRSSLEAQVSRLAGKKAKLKFSTDPALIGGVVAHVGSTVYDGSVRGQLERLRTKLAAN